MGLTRYPQALAQNPQSVAAATRIQRARRAEAARRAEVARAEAAAADVEPLAGLAVSPSGGGGRNRRGVNLAVVLDVEVTKENDVCWS